MTASEPLQSARKSVEARFTISSPKRGLAHSDICSEHAAGRPAYSGCASIPGAW